MSRRSGIPACASWTASFFWLQAEGPGGAGSDTAPASLGGGPPAGAGFGKEPLAGGPEGRGAGAVAAGIASSSRNDVLDGGGGSGPGRVNEPDGGGDAGRGVHGVFQSFQQGEGFLGLEDEVIGS